MAKTKTTTKQSATAPSGAARVPHHLIAGVLERPHASERANFLAATKNQYVFDVNPEANKTMVKAAVEHRYGVTVVKVNMVRNPGKVKQWRNTSARRVVRKKAIVSVKAGQKIEIA